ncbi:sensor histidine kinase [Marinomonas shanghaiensis]|uniref:sensor histidine kinase n=1 Tax=Marinomonas shanghaiensis TaxID=2202418 RepID=UPI003A905667
MEYEAAFQRERKARKNAEAILEQKSRELHFVNLALKENVDSLHFAVRENKFLIHIGRYGLEKPRFRDFLPTIVNDMMHLSDMSFAAFAHFPFDRNQADTYSALLQNLGQHEEQALEINSNEAKEIINEVEHHVKERKTTHLQIIDLVINGKKIDTVIALPVISLDYISGIIFLFSQGLTDKQNQVLNVFKTGIKQLAIIMEHRFQEDRLLESYKEITSANEALKEAQKKLIQSEKMATVGQLSAGIAHEINNPMGFIKSNMKSLGEYLNDFIDYAVASKALTKASLRSPDSNVNKPAQIVEKIWCDIDMNFLMQDTQNLLDESQQGVKRIIDIVGGLKRFSRQSDNQKEACKIHEIIDEALRLANNELKFKGVVNKHIDDVPAIMANSGELLQVFLNLFVNASHAMNEHGELTITLAEGSNGITVKVADNGCGIDEKDLKSIFNPFFTTKDVGVGTGLGLSISYGIIEDHQGTIEVKSELGKGTEFSIWLPYQDTRAASLKENAT